MLALSSAWELWIFESASLKVRRNPGLGDCWFWAVPDVQGSGTILSARQIPVGGDTMWSNQYKAYESLSSGMKEMLDGVRAEFSGARLAEFGGSQEPAPSTLHPICRTHPETGRRALFIGRPGDTLPRLENMSEAESLPIIRYLYEHSIDPANLYRHHWQTGEVVMWDYRCTMHYAVHDYGDEPRDLHRISIQGTVPY